MSPHYTFACPHTGLPHCKPWAHCFPGPTAPLHTYTPPQSFFCYCCSHSMRCALGLHERSSRHSLRLHPCLLDHYCGPPGGSSPAGGASSACCGAGRAGPQSARTVPDGGIGRRGRACTAAVQFSWGQQTGLCKRRTGPGGMPALGAGPGASCPGPRTHAGHALAHVCTMPCGLDHVATWRARSSKPASGFGEAASPAKRRRKLRH